MLVGLLMLLIVDCFSLVVLFVVFAHDTTTTAPLSHAFPSYVASLVSSPLSSVLSLYQFVVVVVLSVACAHVPMPLASDVDVDVDLHVTKRWHDMHAFVRDDLCCFRR